MVIFDWQRVKVILNSIFTRSPFISAHVAALGSYYGPGHTHSEVLDVTTTKWQSIADYPFVSGYG